MVKCCYVMVLSWYLTFHRYNEGHITQFIKEMCCGATEVQTEINWLFLMQVSYPWVIPCVFKILLCFPVLQPKMSSVPALYHSGISNDKSCLS